MDRIERGGRCLNGVLVVERKRTSSVVRFSGARGVKVPAVRQAANGAEEITVPAKDGAPAEPRELLSVDGPRNYVALQGVTNKRQKTGLRHAY